MYSGKGHIFGQSLITCHRLGSGGTPFALKLLIILGILISIEYVSDAHDIKNSPQILQQATMPLSSEITIVRLGGPS